MIGEWIYSNISIWMVIAGSCLMLFVVGYALWAAVKQDKMTYEDEIGNR